VTSYADHLRPFLPYLPSALVSARCLQEILHATRDLPGPLGLGPFMLECGLEEEPIADFSVGVLASRDGPALLAEVHAPEPASPDVEADAWRRIHGLARSWGDPASLLGSALAQVWLEFDVCLTRGGGRAPSVFAGIEPGVDAVPVVRELLDVLSDGRATSAPLSALVDRIRRLPPPTRVVFIGVMLSRGATGVRLVVSTSGRAPTMAFLERSGLPGVAADLPVLTEVWDLAAEVWLAVDVDGSGIRPRTGFDLFCDAGEAPALLDVLGEHGLCTPGKRAALLRAVSMTARESDDAARTGSAQRLATVLGPRGLDRMDLSLDHVKLVGGPGVPAQAKAYLCGTYR
jgi:hypothetical protein